MWLAGPCVVGGVTVAPVPTIDQWEAPPAVECHTLPGKEHGIVGSAHATGLSAALTQLLSSGSEALPIATATLG